VGRVTASIGFSVLRSDETPVANVDRADQALYYAKRAGRNRVEQYEDLLAKGLIAPPSRED
jgi:PleD family two-component response regulator